MLSTTLERTIFLNPKELWLYFTEPRVMLERIHKKYGDWISLHFLGANYALALSPQAAREVFSADSAFQDAFWKESLMSMTGEGSLFVLIGNKHRHERQFFGHELRDGHFLEYGKTIQEITRIHVNKWQPGRTVRTMDTTRAIALDVIFRLVFGIEDQELRREGRQILEAVWSSIHPLIVLFPRLHQPWFPLWTRNVRARANLYEWIGRLVAARRNQDTGGSDVLGNMLSAEGEHGKRFAETDIKDELATILIAGHETTATALAWALYELGRHPAVLEKLREELASLGPDPDLTLAVKLPYLTAVCNETLRLHPPVAEIGRVFNEPTEIYGHKIKAGTSVVVSITAIQHDSEIYPEPDQFIPNRFIERSYSAFEFLPFGGGHRRCLGVGIAENEMRIALAEIAPNWDFEPAIEERDVRHDVAMGPRKGVPLYIRGRR